MLAACDSARPDDPRPGERVRRADKAALYGDPGLVPTRQGERIRRDVAAAREVEHTLAVLPSTDRVHAVVETPPGPPPAGSAPHTAPARVVVTVEARAGASVDTVRQHTQTVVRSIVGDTADIEIVVEGGASSPPAPRRQRWPLWVGLIGLGLCAGVLIERARVLPGSPLRRR